MERFAVWQGLDEWRLEVARVRFGEGSLAGERGAVRDRRPALPAAVLPGDGRGLRHAVVRDRGGGPGVEPLAAPDARGSRRCARLRSRPLAAHEPDADPPGRPARAAGLKRDHGRLGLRSRAHRARRAAALHARAPRRGPVREPGRRVRGLRAELEVDRDGLITHYPDLARRTASWQWAASPAASR